MSEKLGNGDGGTFSDGIITYKRRKICSNGSYLAQKGAGHGSKTCNGANETPKNSRVQRHLKKVLQQLLLSQDANGDFFVSNCIQKALLAADSCFLSKGAMSTKSKFVHMGKGSLCDDEKKVENLQIVPYRDGVPVDDCAISNDHHNVLVDILSSEKFALLCDLLVGNLPGVKVDSLLDFSVIGSKMKNGAYGRSSDFFHEDLQQMWDRVQKTGEDLALLASGLSRISQTYCQRQRLQGAGTEEKNSMDSHTTSEFDHSAKLEQMEVSAQYLMSISKEEECIPAEPFDSQGRRLLHQGCAVCEKLKSSGVLSDPLTYDKEREQEKDISWESSISTMCSDGVNDRLCKLCRMPEEDDKRFIICDHSYCMYKYYHIRCLKSHQVVRQHHTHDGWYCPSCLCRGCQVDKDDELIVMCDGCDEGYHIYCMKPPLSSVPEGKWFCASCNIQRAKQGMRKYEQRVLQQLTQSEDNRRRDSVSRPMDLLLSAAEKVEKLAAGKAQEVRR